MHPLLLGRSLRKALIRFLEVGTTEHLSEVPVHDCPQFGLQPEETGDLGVLQGCDLV